AFLAAYQAEVRRRRDLAVSLLGKCERFVFHPPQGGFYLMAKLETDRWADEEACVCDLIARHGLFPHPGHFYDHEDGIHLVCSTLLHPDRLTTGLTRLCEAVT
ncbi:MAG: pyridoxal phosphate-dependent aminotransferase, partial [Deltaproteobacteria bacterium]|nr:pyridoxal phosphate-dependent aminotransferase [Deltaproteobacteria bacterium]